jgi:hypothetical protein
MDVIQKKYPSNDLYPFIQILQYKDSKIALLGTGGNSSQNYPSDIDFFSKITTTETPTNAYNYFMKMFWFILMLICFLKILKEQLRLLIKKNNMS